MQIIEKIPSTIDFHLHARTRGLGISGAKYLRMIKRCSSWPLAVDLVETKAAFSAVSSHHVSACLLLVACLHTPVFMNLLTFVSPACLWNRPSHKSLKVKTRLGKKMKQNRPIPQWTRMVSCGECIHFMCDAGGGALWWWCALVLLIDRLLNVACCRKLAVPFATTLSEGTGVAPSLDFKCLCCLWLLWRPEFIDADVLKVSRVKLSK